MQETASLYSIGPWSEKDKTTYMILSLKHSILICIIYIQETIAIGWTVAFKQLFSGILTEMCLFFIN